MVDTFKWMEEGFKAEQSLKNVKQELVWNHLQDEAYKLRKAYN